MAMPQDFTSVNETKILREMEQALMSDSTPTTKPTLLVGIEYMEDTNVSMVVIRLGDQRFTFTPDAARITADLLVKMAAILKPSL